MTDFADSTNFWDAQNEQWLEVFLRVEREGLLNESRQVSRKLIHTLCCGHTTRLRVLDVGCGAGVELESYLTVVPASDLDYVGCDSSTKMISICCRRYPTREFCFAHATALPFPEMNFDIVILRHVLEHIREGYAQALSEALCVSPLVLVTFFQPLLSTPDDKLRCIAQHGSVTHQVPMNQYSRDRWEKAIAAHAAVFQTVQVGAGYYMNDVYLISRQPLQPGALTRPGPGTRPGSCAE